MFISQVLLLLPDHLGGAIANLDKPDGKAYTLDTIPLPNANRPVVSAWEREGVGYLPAVAFIVRAHRRAQGVQAHPCIALAVRNPWHEPSDYPTMTAQALPHWGLSPRPSTAMRTFVSISGTGS